MSGTFTISLDFELHWGGFEKWPLDSLQSTVHNPQTTVYIRQSAVDYKTYFRNTREVIPRMLSLFEKYEVHVTWATVGMLFHKDRNELLQNSPSEKPSYHERQLSAYNFIDQVGIGADEVEDPFHFAPSLVKQIANTPYQEIGSHTFSHYYCNEAGQTPEQFRQDLRAAQRVAKQYGVTLRSLVFPRNQFNDAYLKICFEEGITSVRSNPLDWFWRINSTQHESFWKRLNRGLDAYFPVGKQNTYPLSAIEVREGFPVCIPASRLLRPYNPREFKLNRIKVQRIKAEMTRAAQSGEVYHLWWHPHNFGNHPVESLSALDEVLQHYQHCKTTYSMQSLNMGEITTRIAHAR